MAGSSLLFASCALQACGALLLYICGAFATKEGVPGLSPFWIKPAFAIALAGVLLMLLFALQQRHFLLLTGECILVILCFLALDRRGRRS